MGVRGWGEARQSHLIRGRGGHSKRVGGENSQRPLCKGWMAFVLRAERPPPQDPPSRRSWSKPSTRTLESDPGSVIYSLCDPTQVASPL